MGGLDVLIVGAGPAGACAGLVLARAGARVRIVDRARFPRNKLCGDTVNPGALARLRALGVAGDVEARGLRVDGMMLTGERGVAVHGRYPDGVWGRALLRRDLDWVLLQHAVAAGCRVDEGIAIRRAIVDESGSAARVTGVTVGVGGREFALAAPIVIAADGRRSSIAFGLGLARHPERPRRWAIGGYFSNFAPAAFPLNAGSAPGRIRERTGKDPRAYREQSGNDPGARQEHARNNSGAHREHIGNDAGAFRERTRNDAGGLPEPTGSDPETYLGRSESDLEAVRERSGTGDATIGEMHVRRGRYIGIAPVPGGLTNVCVVKPSGPADADLADPAALLARELARDPLLRDRADGARLVTTPVVLGPLAVDADPPAIDGLLIAGDAAGFIDPMTGDGLRFAIRGGELAAGAALDALAGGWSGVHAKLAATRTREFGRKWRFNRALRSLVDWPRAVDAAALAARIAPAVFRSVIARAGDCDAARADSQARGLDQFAAWRG